MDELDPLWLAQHHLRSSSYEECIKLCSELLARNSYDQAAWYLKTRALTLQDWIDDAEVEEEGVAEALLDENAMAATARPGTSLRRPKTGATGTGSMSPAVRPMSGSGRPLTGFARPGTGVRPGTGSVEAAFKGGRPGTTRPVTSSGRFVRLGTASLAATGAEPFIATERLDMRKYAQRPALARVLCDYMLYHEHNPRRALELAAHAAAVAEDWWWRGRVGKCYYQLGMLREAEQQFLSSLKAAQVPTTVLELCKVYARLDQPNTALAALGAAAQQQPAEPALLLAQARLHDALGDMEAGLGLYKQVLATDASSVEAIACLGSWHFYADQPEIALRYFRRLLQMGVSNAELWCNLGLCCFYASQYDMALGCMERAFGLAGDDIMADVWYNAGQIAIGIGDVGLAAQAFKVAVAIDAGHAEAHTNLGVLEARNGKHEAAHMHYQQAQQLAEHAYEPWYNAALAAFCRGNMEDGYRQVNKALQAFPGHVDSQDLRRDILAQLSAL